VLNGVSQTLTITYRFVREADENDTEISWEQRIAKRYYEKLFKEYAICDLKRYKEGRIAMRWRTENEVVVGKGMLT
jgi:protein FRA10AC1